MRRIDLPDDIAEPLGRLLQALKDLRAATGRRFTLDGVALGDLGEAITERLYDVHLHDSQSTKGSDAIATKRARPVEVKITQRRAVGIASHSTVPKYLLVFHLDPETGAINEVYNGLARPAWDRAAQSKARQRRLPLAALRQIVVRKNQRLPPRR